MTTTGQDPLDRFHAAVRRHPDRVAVRDSAAALTFAELDAASAALAGTLAARGVGRGDRVGVAVPRCAGLVVALLAVWRAGAAYVPLDPDYPADRLAYMENDAGVRTVVRPADLTTGGQPIGDAAVSASDAAYLIYTSGSTGRPKAVQATRGGVASLLDALAERGVYAPEPRTVAWNASVSFDASVQQWARVCRGDTVVILGAEHREDPARLVDWLDECGVDDLDLTPSHWDVLREYLLADRPDGRQLRLFVGGEPIRERAWRELAGSAVLEAVNLYGPTECTVDASAAWVTGDRPHIGATLPGIEAHVLDRRLRLVPDGTTGELYLTGSRIADGYLGRPGLTATRFLPGPSGTRMYRTGDLVRRLPSGELGYEGRVDRQVKVRGHRVELGEVEGVLAACSRVARVAVVVRDDLAGQLVAYHVPAGAPAAEEHLRAHAAAALPEFMVPAAFLAVDSIPLTPNGKLDEAALPAPTVAPVRGAEPISELERLIASVWADVLGRDRVVVDDDFFALGGHSLVALRLVSRLKKSYGVPMSTKDVYRHPKLADLARHVESLLVPAGTS